MGSGIGKNAKVVAKQVGGALGRIEALEQGYKGLIEALQGTLTRSDQRAANQEELINAIVVVVGKEAVQEAVNAARVEKATTRSAAEKAALEVAVSEGRAVKADLVSEQSVVVGKEYDKDGNELPPGRVQLIYGQFLDEFKSKLLGQAVGTIFDTPIGGKFEVTEIYDFVAAKQEAEVAASNAAIDAAKADQVDAEVKGELGGEAAAETTAESAA